jgi:hypothetical protein
VKVADTVLLAPAPLYWSHSAIGVNSGGGEIEPCISGAPLAAENLSADGIFAASMVEIVAPRCPSTSGITNAAGSNRR